MRSRCGLRQGRAREPSVNLEVGLPVTSEGRMQTLRNVRAMPQLREDAIRSGGLSFCD